MVEQAGEPQAALGARPAHLTAVAGLIALAAVGALAFADGGYEPSAWGWGALVLAWAAGAALLLRRDVAVTRLQAAQLGALAALWGWTALSAAWSDATALSLEEAKRPLLYVAAAAALAFWARGAPEWLAAGVAAAGALVCAWNLASRRWPDELGASTAGFAGDLGEPIGYENAIGILAALTVLLAAGLALRGPLAVRLGAPVAVLLGAAALPASASRGAWVALAAGAVAALALRLPRPGVAFAAVVAAAAVAIGVLGAAGSQHRQAYWGTTAGLAADDPLLGAGAGTWERGWLRERDEAFGARDAHSLYLETLAELGPLGLALLLAALAPPLVAAVRARARPLVPALAGAYVAFLLHAGVDWDWEVPAVIVAGLACGVALLATGDGPRLRVDGRSAAALGVLAALAAYGLAGSWALAGAADALREGSWERADDRARLASRLEPWSGEALRLRGEAREGAGDREAARERYEQAVAEDPGNVEAWRALARVTEGEARRRALERARRLDPLGAAPAATG